MKLTSVTASPKTETFPRLLKKDFFRIVYPELNIIGGRK
jgi:hypothetical protein